MQPIEKKIFVIGTGRCGSTWIGHWLRQHPTVFGSHETHIFRILSQLLNPDWNQGLKTWISKDQIITLMRHFITESLGRCVHRTEEQNNLVEHSACHYDNIELIKEIFPDALFVHPYRDGRNVVESKIRLSNNDISIADDAINLWNRVAQDVLHNKDKQILHIKYESLVECPQRCREITEFLDISHHKDIDSWQFPVNTTHFSHNPKRWQSLTESVKEKFNQLPMQELLHQLKYATE